MGRRRKKRLPKKVKRLMIGSASGIFLLSVLLFGIVFYTANVEVTGNDRYTDAQVKNMVMRVPLSWNTLLMSCFRKHTDFQDSSFMESVDVEYLNHNSIRLYVREKSPIGYVEYEGYKYYFDKDGIALEREEIAGGEQKDGDSLKDVPLIVGLSFEKAVVGESLNVEDGSILSSLLSLDKMIEKFDIRPDSVEISEGNQITLHYGDVRVLLGKDELLEEKMTRAAGILPKLTGESGELHLEEFTEGTQNIIFKKS